MDQNALKILLDKYRVKQHKTITSPYTGEKQEYVDLPRARMEEQPVLEKGYEEPGVLGQAREALTESYYGARGAFGSTLEAIGHGVDKEGLEEYGAAISAKWEQKLRDNPELAAPKDIGKWTDPRFYARGLGSLVPSLGGALASGVAGAAIGSLGGPAGATIGGLAAAATYGATLEGGYAYKEARGNGASKDDALRIARRIGAINGMLEATPIGRLLKKTPGGKALTQSILKRVTRNMAKQGLAEGSTEAIQEIVSNAFQAEFDENRHLFDNVLESGVFGAMAGGMLGPLQRQAKPTYDIEVTGEPTTKTQIPVRQETPSRILPEPARPLQLPPGITEKPIVPSQDTPLAAFQMVDPKQQKAINDIITKLEKKQAEKQKIIDSGRAAVDVKKDVAKLQKTINVFKEKVAKLKQEQIVVTGPVKAAVPPPSVIQLPAPKKPITEIEKQVLKKEKVVKEKVIKEKPVGAPGRFAAFREKRVKEIKPIIQRIIKQPIKKKPKVIKTKAIEIIKKPKSYKEYLTQSEKKIGKEYSTAVQRILGGRSKRSLSKIAQEKQANRPREIIEIRKEKISKTELDNQLNEMKKKGATENDFRELSFKYFEDHMAGKTKVDKSSEVDTFIEKNYNATEDERLYTRGGRTIEQAEQRLYTTQTQSIDFAEGHHKYGKVKFKLFLEAQNLVRRYGKLVSEKNIGRGKVGVYYGDTGNIGIKSLNDIPTVVHELSHRLDIAYRITELITDKNILNRLKTIYITHYPGAKKSVKPSLQIAEGFATLVENYSLTPTKIKTDYPLLVKELLTSEGEYYTSQIGSLLKDADRIVGTYQALTDSEKIGATIESEKRVMPKSETFNVADDIATHIADYVAPIEKVDEKAGMRWSNKSASISFRHMKNAKSLAINNFSQTNRGFWMMDKNGNAYKKFDYNFKTIALDLAKNENYEKFRNYLAARRPYYELLELDRLNKITNPTIEEKTDIERLTEIKNNEKRDRIVLEKVTLDGNKEFKQTAEQFDNINDALLKLLIDAGMVEKELGAKLLKTKGYAPFFRSIIDEVEGEIARFAGRKAPSTTVATMLARKGSTKVIKDPFINAITASSYVFEKVMLQETYNRLYEMKAGDTIQKIAPEPMPMGKKIVYPRNKGNVFTFKYNGKMVAMKLDKKLVDVFITDLEMKQYGIFRQIARGFSRNFVQFTTGAFYPAFMFKNIMIDLPSAWAHTRNKALPIADGARALMVALKDKNSFERQCWEERTAYGGSNQTQIATYDLSSEELLKKLNVKRLTRGKIQEVRFRIGDILAAPSRYSEEVNRFGEYYKARLAGKSQMIAMEEATRITASFAHKGQLTPGMRTMLEAVPYGNSQIQVIHTFLRAAKDPVTRKRVIATSMVLNAIKVGGFMSIVMAFKNALKSGDEERIEETKALLNEYKNFNLYGLGNHLIFLNLLSGEKIRKVRTPNNYVFMGTLINMALAEQILGQDFKFLDYVEALSDPFIPTQFNPVPIAKEGISGAGVFVSSWLNPCPKAVLESAFKYKSFPKAAELEPFFMANWDSSDRFYPWTNDLAVRLGQTEVMKDKGISPLQIEHFIRTLSGRGMDNITKSIDDGLLSVFESTITEPIKSTITSRTYLFSGIGYKQFYEDKRKMNNAYSRANKAGDIVAKRKHAIPNKVYNSVSSMMTDLRKINDNIETEIPLNYGNKLFAIIELLNKQKYDEAFTAYRDTRDVQRYIQTETRRITIEARK